MEDGMYGVQYHHHHHQHHHHNSPSSSSSMHHHHHHHDDDLHALIARIPPPPSTTTYAYASTSAGESNGIKARIAAHPRYLSLLDAYIDCQKVGAPPEIVTLLDEIRREHGGSSTSSSRLDATSAVLGADPELDLFMETYCDVLVKYKADLSRPFDEATSFLTNMELQLTDLCKTGVSFAGDEPSTDEELSGGEMEVQESRVKDEDRDIKEKLLRKYSGYLSSLKQEFSKKKKKGKLPKEARQTLLDWWNAHYKWPYPTEADKIALAELTGLDQKQINNWFINQRKRHWKPSESMQYAVMDSISAPYYG